MVLTQRAGSPRRFIAGGIALSAMLAGILYVFFDSPGMIERQEGGLLHEVYVWQRHWDPMLGQALERSRDEASGFCVLAAEVSWKAGRVDRVVYVPVNYATLKATGKPVGLALRIGPYCGPFDKQSSATTLVTEIGASLVADARSAGMEPAELQIDFDCAESRLGGYEKWVRAFREKIAPTAVTITVLPSWLKRRAFRGLAQAAGSFVLQVHSLERPTSPAEPVTLCDSEAALRWVEQAARAGVPFRVALPTYGYQLAFNNEGRFIGLRAEGPSQSWGEETTFRVVRSDPIAMAGLVQSWQRDRPGSMQGVIWYRLPVESDRLNWKWATLSAIMGGRVPQEGLEVEVEYVEPELVEIVLANSGETDMPAEVNIEIACETENLVAGDGLRGFALGEAKLSKVCLAHGGAATAPVIRAGERWKVAWLRFKHKTEVKPHVTMPQT